MSATRTQPNASTPINERRVVIDLAYERLAHFVGDDASRETAAAALGAAKFRTGLSDEVRDAVLARFEPEFVPLPCLDYLPEHGEAVAS